MKISTLIFGLGVVLLANAQTYIGQVCSNSNLGGNCVGITDITSVPSFGTTVVGNNAASSMEFTAPDFYVAIFGQINYGQWFTTLRTPIYISNLSPYGWNDQIESLYVTAVPAYTPGVTLFKDDNYGSVSRHFVADNYEELADFGFPNSAMSSVQVFEYTGWMVFDDFGGIDLCPSTGSCNIGGGVTQGTPYSNPDFNPNDAAKSLFVYSNPPPPTPPPNTATTTQAATTTAAVTTTNAAVTTTNAATTTAHAAVTTSVHLATLQAAGPIGGVAYRDKTKQGGGRVPS